ncbi:PSD1 and planctomycete cytochrome C domain-containing protein [Lignipirellula cremea]|uniref:Planctomycete cytochrome C n=1 Tax=Lignipirellula cremea TaxID=2528010 RepID=A0A518DKT7_9BACT|nr:PSD1 and planctomycete cytochrome C domain-containing protein [Lignipirellula cremea]QDU92454.1 Planctomycete cytochrome C [Lignipirellula cremea]
MEIRQRILVAAVILASVLPTSARADSPTAAERLFALRVLPIFKAKCFACHGEDPQEVRGDLNMLSRDGLLQGGESGAAVIAPGKPDESLLYQAVRWDGLEMPPKENDRLSPAQVTEIRQWIQGGAPWPSAQRIAFLLRFADDSWNADNGVSVVTSGGLSADWTHRIYEPENLWAYRPVRAEAGAGFDPDRNPIDVLLEQRLDELQLTAAPLADRRTLLRRAKFDLTGLPPTPEETAAFLQDADSDEAAFARVVDRLLASPSYGEQAARRWLDVVRYADSSGYANDYERGNAWRYRDYVVRSFNRDKPYDQFLREQIAGDEINAADPEMLIAVGFLRMGPWELTGMEVPKVARQRYLDDVTDMIGQVFLGQMLQCARCHDHKFDPIPTRDYYAIQAALATTQLAEREAAFLPDENTDGFEEKKYLQQRLQHYQKTLAELNEKRSLTAARAWYVDQGLDATAFEAAVEQLRRGAKEPPDLNAVRAQLTRKKVSPALIPPRHVGFEPSDFGRERIARKGIERLKWRLERYQPIALSVYSGRTPKLSSVNAPLRMPEDRLTTGELEQTCILTGGDPFSPQQPTAPGVLSLVGRDYHLREGPSVDSAGPLSPDGDALSDIPLTGRRQALAEWIASPKNPLTARVMVNRLWQGHFGRPLAGNPNNFGATGKKPTHPELLDFLARTFVERGWSVKSMHRLLMLSKAYRRSTSHPQPQILKERDPNGESYAAFQPRRLAAEELRDAMLQLSGELNPTPGGIPIRPEMNLESALQPRQVMGTFAEAWQPSPLPRQRHRRSLYALRIRGQSDPFLEVFNAPNPDLSCEARDASNVTPQVFALFNSTAAYARALALARRLQKECASPHEVVERLFQLAYGRSPNTTEAAACRMHWSSMTKRHEGLTFTRPEYPQEVVREAVEENTGERFAFVEPLEFYADFVPDLQPSDADPPLRGLAELCLVILNSNEFVYVY